MIAKEQGAEISPVSFRQRVAADNKFLRFGDLEFDPGATAPAALVDRIFPFGDQTLEAKLLRDSEELIFAAAEFIGEPDIFRRFLE